LIFVSVGSTRFDELVQAIDLIAPVLMEEVVVQIADGSYVPKNCGWFRYAERLDEYLERADLVIGHGGAGVTFEVLGLGKRLISVENPHALEGHQADLLGKLAGEGHLVWCRDLRKLEQAIRYAKRADLKEYVRPACEIARVIARWLGMPVE